MGFTTPLFALSALLPLIVILYYFFRKKYDPTTVSSTLFWQEVMRETRVSPYIQRLQKNSLLWLQLAALLLCVLALMQPYNKKEVMAEEQVIFIVDTSATVTADATFTKHKAAMQQLLKQMTNNEVTIITTGATPTTVVQRERSAKVLEQQVEALQVSYEREYLEKALAVAQSYVGNSPTAIYIFSDGVDRQLLPMDKDNTRFVVKGSDPKLKNISLRRFVVTTEGEGMLGLVQIVNDSSQDASVPLTITDSKGQQLLHKKIAISSGETVTQTYELARTAYATATIDVQDDYSADNTSSAVVEGETLAISMSPTLHELIIKGMQAVAPAVKVSATPTSESFFVTNQTSALSHGQRILLMGRDDAKLKKVTGKVTTEDDTLFSFATFQDVVVQRVYPPIEGATTIAHVGDAPFIQRTAKGDIVVLTELTATDWAMYADFPLFLWSVQNSLTTKSSALGSFSPNYEAILAVEAGDFDIYQDDSYITSGTAGQPVHMPTKPGVYQLRQGEQVQSFVVQLQPEERILPKGTTFALGEANQAQGKKSAQTFVPLLLVPIILLLVIEWEVQRRRGFTN